jgi:hypothetical protein
VEVSEKVVALCRTYVFCYVEQKVGCGVREIYADGKQYI